MREIPLSRGRYVALVDDEDYERIAAHRWHMHSNGHPNRWTWVNGVKRRIAMQRELLGNPMGIIDHANGNRLDNRRENLRICTAAQNAWNCRAVRGKRIKGVQMSGDRWRARIRIDGHLTHLGSFATEWEAALAYDRAAREHFGEFACVNFPMEGERPAA
jgi:hypothetical protein